MFAIKCDNLTKSYKIQHQKNVGRYRTLQESLLNIPKVFLQKKTSTESFLALNDISFEIQPGERVGIIGRNGAGKSTLLKVLSRITEPTSGKVQIDGRVASLLEVGTGFHPELTGRENVFMNGAILGMSKGEIKSKFDEIVDFAEVEKFIDTPVKRYSSGMYVRLAFAVAAHLEPEILLVDEVLAVGDAQFQKKCLGKMEDVSRNDGRTILFVSHNMGAIQAICNKAFLLNKGKINSSGNVDEVVQDYLNVYAPKISSRVNNQQLDDNTELKYLRIEKETIESGDNLNIEIDLSFVKKCTIHSIVVLLYSVQLGIRIAIVDLREKLTNEKVDSIVFSGSIKKLSIVPGLYSLGLYINSDYSNNNFLDLLQFEVISKVDKSDIVPYSPNVCGVLEVESTFNVRKKNDF